MIHKLKTHPAPFNAIEQGLKTFEHRKNDRNFQAGDSLLLQEFDPNHNAYTGKEILVEVQYILCGGDFGIPSDYCIMSIRMLNEELKNMAAFNYGWIQALLSSFRDDSWEELRAREEIKNLLANDDNNDDVIDIEVGDAVFGSIATSIRTNGDEWYMDECFDIYDKNNNLVAENMSFPFER